MCFQPIYVCNLCDYWDIRGTPYPCSSYWESYKAALGRKSRPIVKPAYCKTREPTAFELRLRACPNVDSCPSRAIKEELTRRQKVIQQEKESAAASEERKQAHQEEDFARMYFQKQPIVPRRKQESFFILGRQDLRERLVREEKQARERRERLRRDKQEIMEQWRRLSQEVEDAGAVESCSSQESPKFLEVATRRRRIDDKASPGAPLVSEVTEMNAPTKHGPRQQPVSLTSEMTPNETKPRQLEQPRSPRSDHSQKPLPIVKGKRFERAKKKATEWFTIAAWYPPQRIYWDGIKYPLLEPTAGEIRLNSLLLQDYEVDHDGSSEHTGSHQSTKGRETSNMAIAEQTRPGIFQKEVSCSTALVERIQNNHGECFESAIPSRKSRSTSAKVRMVEPPPGLGFVKARTIREDTPEASQDMYRGCNISGVVPKRCLQREDDVE